MGAKPPTELWALESEALRIRAGGLIDYDFLKKHIISKL